MAKKKKQQRNWLGRLSFGTVSLAVSGLLVLSYLSMVINPARAWFFTLFGLLYPLVLLLAAVLLVWALLRRSRMFWLLLPALLPSLFFAGRFYQLSGPEEGEGPEATLKVVSYNVGLFAHGPKGADRLALADSVSAWLRTQDADLICLQEFRLPLEVPVDSWLRTHFPGYKADYYLLTGRNGRFGNVTLSRLPVLDRGKNSFAKSTNLALWTDVQLDSSRVRIYNCHFESYNISLSALLTKSGAVEETERKMRRSIVERPRQVEAVLRDVEGAPVRTVVLGDFNDTPLSYTYYRLLRGRHDSFVRAGRGFGATYRTLWPLLRIDYILYPPDLEAVTYTVSRVRHSDHYPITASYYETGRNPR